MVEEIDEGFNKAVELSYNKDEEYGLKHLCELSGGLDSRMVMWVAHEQKTRHFHLLEYGESNYLAEVIAKKIADNWKDEILIKPLNDLQFFMMLIW